MIQKLNILPDGVEAKPFFKTDDEYQRFRKDFIEHMEPIIKKQNRARMESELAARNRIVD